LGITLLACPALYNAGSVDYLMGCEVTGSDYFRYAGLAIGTELFGCRIAVRATGGWSDYFRYAGLAIGTELFGCRIAVRATDGWDNDFWYAGLAIGVKH
jgi:hypothetical protein